MKALQGKAHRPGVYQCNECRKQFTVTVGTVFERSKISLNKWLLVTHLMCAGKKGMSADQLHPMLGVSYKNAWSVCHRIREAMRDEAASSGPLGGAGQIVEADETYFGDKETDTMRTKHGKSGLASKCAVFALVERGGKVHTFHVESAKRTTVGAIVAANVNAASRLFTDESRLLSLLALSLRITRGFVMPLASGCAVKFTPIRSKTSSPPSSAG